MAGIEQALILAGERLARVGDAVQVLGGHARLLRAARRELDQQRFQRTQPVQRVRQGHVAAVLQLGQRLQAIGRPGMAGDEDEVALGRPGLAPAGSSASASTGLPSS